MEDVSVSRSCSARFDSTRAARDVSGVVVDSVVVERGCDMEYLTFDVLCYACNGVYTVLHTVP